MTHLCDAAAIMDIVFRPALAHDVDSIAVLAAQWRNLLQHSALTDAQLVTNISRALADSDTDLLIALSEASGPLGFVQLRYRYSLWSGRTDAYVEDIFVTEQARGNSVGTRLMELAVERAVARDCALISVYTNSNNAESIALYERFGFASYTRRFPDSRNYYFSKTL